MPRLDDGFQLHDLVVAQARRRQAAILAVRLLFEHLIHPFPLRGRIQALCALRT
ncbi:hypothetical protein D9M73_277520 [compost metagenome]